MRALLAAFATAAIFTTTAGLAANPAADQATYTANPSAVAEHERFGRTGAVKDPSIQVDEDVLRELANGASRTIALEFASRPDLSAAYGMPWGQRGRFVLAQLQAHAERSQAEVRNYLRQAGKHFNAYYVKNVILVHDADMRTLNQLLTFNKISRVRIPPPMKLIQPDPLAGGTAPVVTPNVAGSNIAWVGADQVWGDGFTGEGTVVGNIDSGVRYSHEALVTQYRGNNGDGTFDHNYNWYDPEVGSTAPQPASPGLSDQHGTHTMGTMVGDDFDPDPAQRNQVGMAPGAKWIACQGFPAAGSVDAALLGCGQFMLAPHDLNGDNPDPDLRPMVVNNSWGACTAGAVDDFYTEVVENWVAAGVMPVFSNGNASNCGYPAPPGLSTVGSPGSYGTVLGVGSTGNSNGQYATHSNWGPTEDLASTDPASPYPDPMGYPALKPNVVAPGVSIRSTIGTNDTAYDASVWTGTSMSAPHVAGLMALMFEAAPCLVGDFRTTGTIIMQTARPIDYASGGTPPPGPGNIPNYATGWGEIDAPAAVAAAMEACGPQGTIEGTVTEAGSGDPIENATVEIYIDPLDQLYTVTTDENGEYERSVAAGTGYTVDVSAFGYIPDSQTGIDVAEDATVTVDFVLAVAPSATISGTVTDSATGWPLHARIQFSDYPNGAIWSDPVTGEYSISLPIGFETTATANATVEGYLAGTEDITVSVSDTVDFALDADATVCEAPGYSADAPIDEDFEGLGGDVLPAGWTRTSNSVGWVVGDDLGSSSFNIPAHTTYVASNDDAAGQTEDGSVDYLVSPTFSLAGATDPVLQFDSFFTGAWSQLGFVESSIDGGSSWQPVGVPSENAAWVTESMSLASVAGQASVQLRFHADDDGAWASGWAIDDVSILLGCNPPATGGLIVGEVTDANTGDPIFGAEITTDGGESTTSIDVADPAITGGFYTVYGDGTVEVTASIGGGFADATATVAVPDGDTIRQDLALDSPQLALTPATIDATLELGDTAFDVLTVSNEGNVGVGYDLLAAIVSEDFEDGLPDDWTNENLGGDCVWTTTDAIDRPNFAGGDGAAATADSDICGEETTMDTALVSPPIDLSQTGTASLDFVMSFRRLGADRLDVDVSTNGGSSWTTLFTQTVNESAQGPGTPVSIDLSAYAGASNVRVRFRFVADDWNWWVQIDQLRLNTEANGVTWLAINPGSGSLGPAPDSNDHNVVFDAAQVDQPGVYTARIVARPQVETPTGDLVTTATMTVTAPASFGTLTGTVTGLGYCDANPVPAAQAQVTIQGPGTFYTTTTDDFGEWSFSLDASSGPFTVSATAPGHLPSSESGVTVEAGGTTEVDLDLRAELPCLDVVQTILQTELDPGETTVLPIDMLNLGAAPIAMWEARVGGSASEGSEFALSQSESVIEDATGVACSTTAGNFITDNFFIRRFPLAAEGFTSDVQITAARFGVELAVSGTDGTQPASARVYLVDGDFVFANMTELLVQDFTIADDDTGQIVEVTFDAPVTVGPNDVIALAMFTPDSSVDGSGDEHQFFPGANTQGETAPSYIASEGCGILDPTPYADIGFPEVALVMEMQVTAAAPCRDGVPAVTWLSLSPTSGSIPADGSAQVEATFDATGLSEGVYEAAVCVSSDDEIVGDIAIPAVLGVGQNPAVIFASGFEDGEGTP